MTDFVVLRGHAVKETVLTKVVIDTLKTLVSEKEIHTRLFHDEKDQKEAKANF